MILSIPAREQQLRERLNSAISKGEAIYFDFVRNDYTKQIISPLLSMQSVISINDVLLEEAKNDKVRAETKDLISRYWRESLSSTSNSIQCIENVSNGLLKDSVLKEQGARKVAQNICVNAERAKSTLLDIRTIGAGNRSESDYIGSDVQGAFMRGISRLESESSNLLNSKNEFVRVVPTIIISSDMVQRSGNEESVVKIISSMNEEEIAEYVMNSKGNNLEIRSIRPLVKIDGWLSTKSNFSEPERISLEKYWKSWFLSMDLDEPDFGYGVIDWSVD